MTQAAATPAAVLDTNVVIDWLMFGDPAVAALANAVERGRVHWLVSRPMRDELCHVASRGVFARRNVRPEQMLDKLDRLSRAAPEAAACALRCSDAADQMFIDLALAESAHWLVSRDRALLRLARRARTFRTIVCTPADWTERVA